MASRCPWTPVPRIQMLVVKKQQAKQNYASNAFNKLLKKFGQAFIYCSEETVPMVFQLAECESTSA